MKPTISIIIPTYNQGKFINETLLSIINQHYEKTEIIVIDGGSTDETVTIIKSYEKHISYWISEKDNGQTDAIIKGLKKASGDVLCWINSDDFYLPNALKQVGTFFETHLDKPVVLTGNTRFIDEQGNLVWEPNATATHETVPKKLPVATEKLLHCWNFSLSQPSTFWNRKVLEIAGMPDEKLKFTMDLDYWINMHKAGAEFYFDSFIFSCFRYHGESKTTNLKKIQQEELEMLGTKYLQTDKERRKYKQALKNYFGCKLLLIQSDRLSRSNRKEAFRHWRNALKHLPWAFFVYPKLVFKIPVKLLLPRK